MARGHVEARLAAAQAAEGHMVDETDTPPGWTLVDRAGNRACVAACPDSVVPTAQLSGRSGGLTLG